MLSTFNEQSVWFRPIPARGNKSMMEVLFGRMSGTYPNRWRANFQGENAIKEWEEAWATVFDAEGITPNDIALGIQNCNRMFDWPPSLPEFLKACRPHLEPDVAFFEAVRGMQSRAKGEDGTWSHPAIFHASIMVGQFEMINQSYQQLANRWKKALAEQLALGQWPAIPETLPQIENSATTEQDAANARKVRQQVVSAVSNGKGPLKWVESVLENQDGKCMFAINAAKKLAKERNLPVWQKFKHEEKNEEVTA